MREVKVTTLFMPSATHTCKEESLKVTTRFILCCLFCLSLASLTSAQQSKSSKAQSFNTSGTFSSITATDGGDYVGMEIYLTDSDGQFYATVTIAQGVLLPPVLVKVQMQVEARKLEFTLPGQDGSRKFTGTVAANGLTLTENGESHLLNRKCYN
jgi:hypothetical protein